MKLKTNSLLDRLKQENGLESFISSKLTMYNLFSTKISVLSDLIKEINERYNDKSIENLTDIKVSLIEKNFSIDYSDYFNIQESRESFVLEQHLKFEQKVVPLLVDFELCNIQITHYGKKTDNSLHPGLALLSPVGFYLLFITLVDLGEMGVFWGIIWLGISIGLITPLIRIIINIMDKQKLSSFEASADELVDKIVESKVDL